MTRSQIFTLLVPVYGALLLGIAIWAHRRTHHPNDFLVANRRGTAVLVGLSQAMNVLPAWLMLFVSASAFVSGITAVWIALALWLAGLLQAFFVMPRARQLAASQHSVSLLQLLTCECGERAQRGVVRCASFFVAFATVVIIVIQLQLVGAILSPAVLDGLLGLSLIAAFLIAIATAGWWACAALEAVQGVTMLLVVMFSALLASAVIGGADEIGLAMRAIGTEYVEWDGGRKLVIAIALIGGSLSLAGLPLGQPSLLNRAIAARDEKVIRASGIVLMVWLTVMLPCLLAIGWFARVLYFSLPQPELGLLEISRRTVHPAMSATIELLTACALLTNVAAQLGVLSTMFVNDLRPGKAQLHAEWSRVWAVVMCVFVIVLLQFVRPFTLGDLAFCWTALGAALAPLLIVRLAGKRVRAGSMVGAMSAGFLLVCVFHAMPEAPGDFLERVLPFVAGLGIALSGGERRRTPDRADRSEETLHDRLPL
jgi:Na+/proline symporter